MNRFAGIIRQVCLLSRRGLTFTLWNFFYQRKNLTSSCLLSLMSIPSSTSRYQFRRVPYPVPGESKISSLSSFIPRSIILWNTLPSLVQSVKTVSLFKSVLKFHMHICGLLSFSFVSSLSLLFSQLIQSGAWL